jgi:hypothetical protein
MTFQPCKHESGLGLVSVVIPMKDAAQYVRPCLESVCGKSYENIEIIVVDYGSSDGADKLIGAFGDPRVKLARAKEPLQQATSASQPPKANGSSYWMRTICWRRTRSGRNWHSSQDPAAKLPSASGTISAMYPGISGAAILC